MSRHGLGRVTITLACASAFGATTVLAQVDPERATQYFKEAAVLCEREGGRLWGKSLCGPMVFADPATRTIATNQPEPAEKRPPMLGYANAAVPWGGMLWATIVWPLLDAAEERGRGRGMLHELFHRIQPELGLNLSPGHADHLDTLEGRYWIQLEWRALAKAIAAKGDERAAAIRDALAFRTARRRAVPEKAEDERMAELHEGLAEYTGIVGYAASPAEAEADTVERLGSSAGSSSYVRSFAYASGAGYGMLLDGYAPGWTRRIKPADDLGRLLMEAARVEPSSDADAAAKRYDGEGLWAAERKRNDEREARVADLRRRFVEGPVLLLPGSRKNTFTNQGMTPLGDAGLVYPAFRGTAEWGTVEAALILMSTDKARLTLPAPATSEGATLKGEGWTVLLSPGWVVRAAARKGDLELVRDSAP